MNESLAENNRTPPAPLRTKITQWRSPSRKIMLTEMAEKYSTASAWSYSSPLTQRHRVRDSTAMSPEIPILHWERRWEPMSAQCISMHMLKV